MPNWKKVIVSGSDATLNSLNVVSGSILSGSITATGSFNLNGNQTITGSLNISGSTTATSFTGSLFGTASYATNALTASFALNGGGGGLSALYIQDEGVTQGTASYINFIGTGVTATVTSGTASISVTGGSSGAGESVLFTQASPATTWTFSHNLNSQYLVYDVYDSNSNAIIPANVSASSANTLIITFGVATAGYAVATVGGGLPFISASFNGYVLTASGSTAAWAPTSSLSVLSASYATTASFVTLAQTASYVVTAQTASFVATASYANNADLLDGLNSTIFATTGSNTFIGTQTITGSILQSGSFTSTGTITAQTLVVQTITSSIVYSSGSNIFGNSLANTQTFTGSILTTGSLNANNVLYVTGSNVGIGTTSPGAKLEITDASATYAAIIRNTTAGGDYLKMIGDSGNTVFEFGSGGTGGDGFLNIYSDNSQKVLINADGVSYFNGGNVGIGTTSPVVKLDIFGLTNTSIFNVRQSAGMLTQIESDNGYANLFLYQAGGNPRIGLVSNGSSFFNGGNVGIGTTSPTAKLQISGSNTDAIFQINSPASASILVVSGSGNIGIGTTSPSYKLDVVNAGTNTIRVQNTLNTSDAYLIAQNTLGSTFFGINATGGYIYNGGALPILFYTSGSERMRILSDGNVGIGTTAPGGNLEITGFKSSPSTNPLLLLSNTANPVADAYMVRAFSDSDNNGAGKREEFFLRSDGLVYFRGNVGIGTTSPSAKLDVNGNSIITGSLTVITGSAIEFQVTNTGVKIGNDITDNHTVTGSLNISGSTTSTSFTGSLFGTSSYASNALTASYALTATSASYAATASVSSTTFGIGATIQTYGSVASSVTGSNNIFTQNTGSFTSAFFKYTAASGSNTRAGEVISVWNSTTTSSTDFSTVDIGNTNNVTASISIVTGQVQFNIQTNSSGWAIKSIATFM